MTDETYAGGPAEPPYAEPMGQAPEPAGVPKAAPETPEEQALRRLLKQSDLWRQRNGQFRAELMKLAGDLSPEARSRMSTWIGDQCDRLTDELHADNDPRLGL